MAKNRYVIVSVTNDLCTDQRVAKVCQFLVDQGYRVTLVGRNLPSSWELKVPYATKRFNLIFNKGPLFYINYSISLFFYLLWAQRSILLSNDLDTLFPNFIISKLKQVPLVYDSHEYFTEVPELINRPFVQRVWESIEKSIVPQLKLCYTVSGAIAEAYEKKYGVQFMLVRNLPKERVVEIIEKENRIIYQGALNVGRGLEYLIESMQFVEGELIIAGTGDIEERLRMMVNHFALGNKVRFVGRLNASDLFELTKTAKIGVSLEEELGLNYTYALPNKLFDYIQARVPVLVSSLPEMKKVTQQYGIGEIINSHDPKVIGDALNRMLASNHYQKWVENCDQAARILNWENEQTVLKEIFSSL